MAQVAIDRPEVRARTRPAERRLRVRPSSIAFYALLIVLALGFVLPLVWMVSTALKSESAVFTDQGWIPQNPSLENFQTILDPSAGTPIVRYFINSVIVASLGTALVVLLTSMSAYAFARMEFRGKNVLFAVLIATLFLPAVMFLVPQFLIVNQAGLLNSIPALIVPILAGVFGVFFMRQFFLGIPIELEEAAYVDGATRVRTYWSVVLPLARAPLATLGVITFLTYWNDYVWPLITCEGDGCTLTPGLRNLQGQYTAEYGLLMAGATIAAVPVLLIYLVAQRYIVQSVTSSGIKG
jgi:multiple sugar transport system permease protein